MFLDLTHKAMSFIMLLPFRYATTLLLIQNGSICPLDSACQMRHEVLFSADYANKYMES